MYSTLMCYHTITVRQLTLNFTNSLETTLVVESCGFLIARLWAFLPGRIYLPKT